MTLSIIFVPLIILMNSFFMGKLFKRFNNQLNSYLTTILGFFGFFGLASLVFTVIVLFTINLSILLYILLAFQSILAILYIVNWRWLFITYNINWKKIIFFFVLITISLIGFLLTRNFVDSKINWYISDVNYFYNYYISNFLNANKNEIYIFEFGSNYFNTNFIYILFSSIAFVFKVGINDLKLFYMITNSFMVYIIIASLSIHLYSIFKEHSIYRKVTITLFFALMVSLISFWLDQYLWVILFTLWLVLIQTSKQNEINSQISIWVINFIVLTGVLFDIQFLLIALTINIVQLFISYKAKKENATDYNILMLFSTFLYTCLIFDNKKYLSFILIIIMLVIYSIYMFYKSSNIAQKINKKIDMFLYAQINWISIIFLALMLILSITFFISIKNFDIFAKPWILAGSFFNFNVINASEIMVNIFFWIVNIIIFLNVLFNNSLVRFKKLSYDYFPEADLSMMLIIAFWNPISINLFSLIYNIDLIYMQPNFQVLFFAVLSPLLISVFRKTNYRNKKLSNIIYASTFLISTIIIVSSINMGVL